MRKLVQTLLTFSILFLLISPNTSFAKTNEINGKLTPPAEKFTPGQWFLGSKPPNYNANRPPIVFVQGKNGSSTSWYGETVYHGVNDMYTKAYEAGYQTVFVQLYDAAGNGSYNQYDNGRLLANMLAQINSYFGGKKVNIVAHSKGGPDTQAALITYGAHRYVGRVITLGSPHHGSNLADLSYSWYAGWLGELLGQNDAGTYSLQTGEMAKFRSAIDRNSNSLINKYYTVAGTHTGPTFSALSFGGLYLSSYGDNDGLVNVWSSKLPYGTHLFTDANIDHDNIRMASKVFSRIEPYLRSSTVSSAATSESTSMKDEQIGSVAGSSLIRGGKLEKNNWVSQKIEIDKEQTADISLFTASPDVQIELVSPSGKTYKNSVSAPTDKENTIFTNAFMHSFTNFKVEAGTWNIRMKTTQENDAYFVTTQFDDTKAFTLTMPAKAKQKDTAFYLTAKDMKHLKENSLQFTISMANQKGKVFTFGNTMTKIQGNTYGSTLPTVPVSGTYNITIDIQGKTVDGNTYSRTIVSSIYIEK